MKYILDETKRKKKKDCDSVSYTTGSIDYNISQFNKHMGTDFNNPSTEEAKANKAAEQACKDAGTFASQSPDGGSSISTADAGAEGGEGMAEELKLDEAKRYVRRYYIRPQNIFCSNKTDILKALIKIDDQNCSIYTLNNLGDEKDVTKLKPSDIIYYYDNGILYDKNKVKVMDYDLYIKHEEKRDEINPDKVTDAKFDDVYDDRITDADLGKDEATDKKPNIIKSAPVKTESVNEELEDEYSYITTNGWKVLNAPKYAKDYKYIVARTDWDNDCLWFWGAYDEEDRAQEAADFIKNGKVIYAKNTEFYEGLRCNDELDQDFDDYNVYGERLHEGKEIDGICCICGEPIEGYGNNAEPYKKGRCCDACNIKFVIPARMNNIENEEQAKED